MAAKFVLLLGILAGVFACPAMGVEASPELAKKAAAGAAESGKSGEVPPMLPWVEIQAAKISTRYGFAANDRGITTKNQQMHKEAFKVRFLFGGEEKYSLTAAGGSGTGFTSSLDALGIGSDATSNLNFRELFLSLKPWKEFELQYGGIAPNRGVSTEITTFDNDAYIDGARISLKSPKKLFFDEISGTLAYLGDLTEPDVLHRLHRLNEANYHQVLVSKKIGRRAVIGGDYTSQWSIATLRQAIQVKLPELKVIDAIRFENYQRIEGIRDCGFAVQADKKIRRWLALGGGYADIDRLYGGLNADRFNKGRRVFASAKIDLIDSLIAEIFIQQAVANHYSISNDIRLDLALTYDFLPELRKLRLFRIPKY
jgi:hypothetical protein